MKLHGICLVKNEADFLERSMAHSLQWFDTIYLYDNGSTDGTWELIQELAAREPRLVPFKQDNQPFRDHLRSEVFHKFHDRAQAGDWWCRLDADEIYVDNPRDFLAGIPPAYHVVWSIHFQYYFSEIDQARWEADAPSAALPLPRFADLPRSYQSNSGEARYFRHRQGLRWEGAWPHHMGLVAPQRIRLKHYQYRSPRQIQRRLETRREAARRGYQTFGHSLEERWEEKVVDSAKYHQDDLSGNLIIDEHLLPRHLEKPHVRLLKRAMHGSGLWV